MPWWLLLAKMGTLAPCAMGGPGVPVGGCRAACYDWDKDGDVDLYDWALMERRLGSNAYGGQG